VRFGNNLILRPREQGGWEVLGGEMCFDLADEREVWRTVALLEKPLPEVRAAIDRTSEEPFPFARIAQAGLRLSAHWARLALGWIEDLDASDRAKLAPALRDLAAAPWADQRLRHAARRLHR
jgi:hypothetical protein